MQAMPRRDTRGVRRDRASESLPDEGETDCRTGVCQVHRMAAETPRIQRQLQDGQQKALNTRVM